MTTRWAIVSVLAAAMALSACGTSQSPSGALRTWASAGSFRAGIVTLLADSARVHGVLVSHASQGQRHTVCAELTLDAQGTNDELPTPDAQLTTLLSRAYDQLVGASSHCYSAVTPAAIAAAEVQRHAAVGLLVQAVLRFEAVEGTSLRLRGIA